MSNPTSNEPSSSSGGDDWFDEWPKDFDGTGLYKKVIEGRESDFRFSVNHLIELIEDKLASKVVDIPMVSRGSNNFGFHVSLASGQTILARISRSDVNWPGYDGFPFERLSREAGFEVAIYHLLNADSEVPASRLLFHHLPVLRQHETDEKFVTIPQGRRLFVFERSEGRNNVWWKLDLDGKRKLLTQLAEMRCALFRHEIPLAFAKSWLPSCFPNPNIDPAIIFPNRNFTLALLTAKVVEVIKNEGDPIGWESDHNFAGPVAVAAKLSLLRLIPLILPPEDGTNSLYRFVVEHGDYGIHNMTIIPDIPKITSLYDWETGHIVPAILSDPEVSVEIDIGIDSGGAVLSRLPSNASEHDLSEYSQWGEFYFQIICKTAPEYMKAIKAGKDARHIWMAFKNWRGADPERYFGVLGNWAEGRLKDLSKMKSYD